MGKVTMEVSAEKRALAFQTLLLIFGNATMVRLVLEEAEREAKKGKAFELVDARGTLVVDLREGMRVESSWNESVGMMIDARKGVPTIGDLCWVRYADGGVVSFFVAEFAGMTRAGDAIWLREVCEPEGEKEQVLGVTHWNGTGQRAQVTRLWDGEPRHVQDPSEESEA